MDLSTYMREHALPQSALAERVGVSQSMVSHWLTGRKQVTPEKAKAIELVTHGAVQRHELRPDIFDPPATAAPVSVEEGVA